MGPLARPHGLRCRDGGPIDPERGAPGGVKGETVALGRVTLVHNDMPEHILWIDPGLYREGHLLQGVSIGDPDMLVLALGKIDAVAEPSAAHNGNRPGAIVSRATRVHEGRAIGHGIEVPEAGNRIPRLQLPAVGGIRTPPQLLPDGQLAAVNHRPGKCARGQHIGARRGNAPDLGIRQRAPHQDNLIHQPRVIEAQCPVLAKPSPARTRGSETGADVCRPGEAAIDIDVDLASIPDSGHMMPAAIIEPAHIRDRRFRGGPVVDHKGHRACTNGRTVAIQFQGVIRAGAIGGDESTPAGRRGIHPHGNREVVGREVNCRDHDVTAGCPGERAAAGPHARQVRRGSGSFHRAMVSQTG